MSKFKLFFPLIKNNKLLVLILLIAALLRIGAVYPGFNQYHTDEPAIWGSALNMIRHSTLDPGRYDYPATTMLINAFFYKFLFIPLGWIWYYLTHFWDLFDGVIKIFPTEKEMNRVFTLYIIGERGVNAIFWARYVTAFFGVGTVFLTYLLSKKMFSERVGLLAALFLTFNYRNVMNSHLSLPDIYNAFFLLLALIACWNLMQKPSRLAYLLAGIFCGLA
ncbi:MAG: Glycosyl transferase family protein, partial [Microgenomates group bacterium Gr01-1014_93]